MSQQAKRAFRLLGSYALVLCLLTVASSVFERGMFLLDGLSRTITCCLCMGWAYLVGQRVLHARLRQLLRASAWLLASLIILQELKYNFTTPPSFANRFCWYAYYVPITWAPLLSFLSALEIGTSPRERPLRPWRWLVIPALVLTCGFLTNDLHQLAFSFPGPRATWDDAVSTHGPLYLVEVVWIVALMLGTFVVAAVRNARLASLRSTAVALVPLAVGAAYLVSYILNGSTALWFGAVRLPQFQEVFCLMLVTFWEALVQEGAIPSNSGYRQLFEAATFPAFIADETGIVRFKTSAPMQANVQQRAAAAGGPVATGAHTLLHAMTIHGGSVYWESDLTQVHEARARLAELRQQLTEHNEQLAQQNALAEERSRNEAQARLYEQAYAQLDPWLATLSAQVAAARETDDRRDIEALLVEGTFVKRRANLGIVAQQLGQIPTEELALALRETLAALELCGMRTSLRVEGAGLLAARHALAAYEAFGQAAQALWDAGASACSALVDARNGLLVRIVADGLPWEDGPLPEQDFALAEQAVSETGGALRVTCEDGITYVSLLWKAVGA